MEELFEIIAGILDLFYRAGERTVQHAMVAFVQRACGADDFCAFLREQLVDFLADTAACAGDDGRPSLPPPGDAAGQR